MKLIFFYLRSKTLINLLFLYLKNRLLLYKMVNQVKNIVAKAIFVCVKIEFILLVNAEKTTQIFHKIK